MIKDKAQIRRFTINKGGYLDVTNSNGGGVKRVMRFLLIGIFLSAVVYAASEPPPIAEWRTLANANEFQKALTLALTNVDKYPDEAGRWQNLAGSCYIALGKYAEAAQITEQALTNSASLNDPILEKDIRTNLYTAYFNSNNYQNALDQAKVCASKYPTSSEWQYNIGNCYLKLDKPADAVNAYEIALSNPPDTRYPKLDKAIRGNMYAACIAAKELEKAVAIAKWMLDNKAGDVGDWSYRAGDCLIGLGRYDQAVPYLETALQKAKESKDISFEITCRHTLYTAYIGSHEFGKGLILAQECAAKYSGKATVSEWHSNIGNCYLKLDKPADAVNAFEAALSNPPDTSNPMLDKAIRENMYPACIAAKELEKAVAIAKWMLDNNAGNAGDWSYRAGDCSIGLGKYDQAVPFLETALQKALEIKDISFEKTISKTLHAAYMGSHQFEKGMVLARDCAAKYPEKAAEWTYLVGVCQYGLQKYEDALSTFKTANEMAASLSDESLKKTIKQNIYLATYKSGDYQTALTMAGEYLTKYPSEFDPWLHEAGACLLELRRFEDAQSKYQELLNKAPDSQFTKLALISIGYSLCGRGKIEEGLAYIDKASEKDLTPEFQARILLSKASAVGMYGKQYEIAIPYLTTLIEKYPNSTYLPNAYELTAILWISKPDWAKARTAFAIASSKFPKAQWYTNAKYDEGICYLHLGNEENARIIFEGLAANYPKDMYGKMAQSQLATRYSKEKGGQSN